MRCAPTLYCVVGPDYQPAIRRPDGRPKLFSTRREAEEAGKGLKTPFTVTKGAPECSLCGLPSCNCCPGCAL